MKTLKIISAILLLSLLLSDCKKEEPKPSVILTSAVLQTPTDGSKNISNTEVSFTWKASEGGSEILYDLRFGVTENPKTQIASALQSSIYTYKAALKLNAKYYWKVVAKNTEGKTAESAVFSFTTHSGFSNPVLLTPKNSEGQVDLSPEFAWQASEGGTEITYDFYFGENEDLLTKVVSDLTTTKHTYSGTLEKNKVYYWKVISKNGEGIKAESSVFTFTTSSAIIVPTLLSTYKDTILTSTENIVLEWKKSVFVSGGSYDLYFDQNSNPTTQVGFDLKDNKYSVANPKVGLPGVFYWKVVAKDGKGGKKESRVFKILTDVFIEIIAGNGTRGVIDGKGKKASFYFPRDLQLNNAEDMLYILEGKYNLRTLNLETTEVKKFNNTSGSNNGYTGITVDSKDNFYYTVTGDNYIYKFNPIKNQQYSLNTSIQGFKNGENILARFFGPQDLVTDSKGNLYVADQQNDCIRYMDFSTNTTSTFVGNCTTPGYKDGKISEALIDKPTGIALSSDGNILYFSEKHQNRIRKVDFEKNQISIFAGLSGYSHIQPGGYLDGNGVNARFIGPTLLVIDKWGNLIVSDGGNCLRLITPTGVVSTLTGKCGSSDTQAIKDDWGRNAEISGINGITIDRNGNIYVTEYLNGLIKKIHR